MKIVVTGATGFVGRQVVPQLLLLGHQVVAVARNSVRLEEMAWRNQVRLVCRDIHADDPWDAFLDETSDALIHLAWPGLPNYKEHFHFEKTLPADCKFLKGAIDRGIRHVLITGTGAEYGMLSGCLREDMPTEPANAYGIAKDCLRRYMFYLKESRPFRLQWVRLFHMHGPGQNPSSVLAQLDRAIDEGASSFPMSGGEQLRDYLSVEEVARRLSLLISRPECEGIINCCSGTPVSIRRLVEDRLQQRGVSMVLKLGQYPYPEYESMAYWGDPSKLRMMLSSSMP